MNQAQIKGQEQIRNGRNLKNDIKILSNQK
jgi:hypothetical protein